MIICGCFWLSSLGHNRFSTYSKQNSTQPSTSSLDSVKLPPSLTNKTTANPVFATPSASLMGGIPSGTKSKVMSPKVYPAPQPPLHWPIPIDSTRVKKLNWGDDKVRLT